MNTDSIKELTDTLKANSEQLLKDPIATLLKMVLKYELLYWVGQDESEDSIVDYTLLDWAIKDVQAGHITPLDIKE